jgi:outer membrane lipoprotein SlyB
MKKFLMTGVMVALVALGSTACTPNISPDVTQASDANEVQTALEGVIVSKRVVTVKGDSVLGTLAGAGLGAVAGSTVGGGSTMHTLMAITGGLAGGAAGNAIESKLTTQQGIEYVIRLAQTDNGATTIRRRGYNAATTTISHQSSANRYVTVVQGQGSQALPVGQRVLVAGVGTDHAHILSTL